MAKAHNHKNQYGEVDRIGKTSMDELREKWKEFEGTRLEKSINKPIFLTSSIKQKYKEREQ